MRVACLCLLLGRGRLFVGLGGLQGSLGYVWCYVTLCRLAFGKLLRCACSGLCYSLGPGAGSFCILINPCSSRALSGACFMELNSC